MKKVVFFSIPAYGHTNLTIEVVHELTSRGNVVWYYSFNEFKERIEKAGAKFISCNEYLPKLKAEDKNRVGKDFSFLIEMIVDTTMALDEKVCKEIKEFKPDVIVSDSLSIWGKLIANKLKIPYICSTTTFAFNNYTAKMIKRSFKEIIYMILGMGKVNKKIQLLRDNGYEIKDFISIVQNTNDTKTIVYTSKDFQPMSETFGDKYAFVGPSISKVEYKVNNRRNKKIYISLGTVNNYDIKFYKKCIDAFKNTDIEVIMSIGKHTKIDLLGTIPENFVVENTVNQIEVLQDIDLFITHCGMNSVNESLYYGVPMVLYPKQSEQGMVAQRVSELGAGVMLKNSNPKNIKETALKVLNDKQYRTNAEKLGMSFKLSGGAKKAADFILE